MYIESDLNNVTERRLRTEESQLRGMSSVYELFRPVFGVPRRVEKGPFKITRTILGVLRYTGSRGEKETGEDNMKETE